MLTTVDAFRALVRPLPISATTFAPIDAVQAAITLARQEADRPDAVVHLTPAPSGTVHGDRVLLEEAIAAVVRNAIEASALVSPAPAVEVSVAQASAARGVEIVVTDCGPGVADGRPRQRVPALRHRQARTRRARPRPRRAGAARASGRLDRARASACRRARRHDRPAAARLIAAATQELRLRPPPRARLLHRRAGGLRHAAAIALDIPPLSGCSTRPDAAGPPFAPERAWPSASDSGVDRTDSGVARLLQHEGGRVRDRRGFTLVEAVVALALVATVGVSVSTALVASRAMAVHDRDQAIGRVAAQARLATLTSLAFHTIAGADGSAVAVTDTTTDVSGDPQDQAGRDSPSHPPTPFGATGRATSTTSTRPALISVARRRTRAGRLRPPLGDWPRGQRHRRGRAVRRPGGAGGSGRRGQRPCRSIPRA